MVRTLSGQLMHAAGAGLPNTARCRTEQLLSAIHSDGRSQNRYVTDIRSPAFLFHAFMTRSFAHSSILTGMHIEFAEIIGKRIRLQYTSFLCIYF